MKTTKSRSILGLIFLLIGGLYLGDRFFLQKRGLASLKGTTASSYKTTNLDLSDLSGKDFQRAFKIALIQGLQVQKNSQVLGLSFGLFSVQSSNGAKVYACEKYPNIEITLNAEGIANSGNIPSMIIRGPCLVSDDGNKIQAFAIPLKDLPKNLRENPKWRVSLGNRGDSFMISTQYLYNEWPTLWNVVQVKLYNDQESLEMDGYEIISLLDQALTLDFSEEE
ncbi:MAG: hypothetical protein ACXWRE_06960 [Pseudobdellovibrionaceae bacterium]